MIKQEMARVNVDILGISELKWTGIGEFKSDDQGFPSGPAVKNLLGNARTWVQSLVQEDSTCREVLQLKPNATKYVNK